MNSRLFLSSLFIFSFICFVAIYTLKSSFIQSVNQILDRAIILSRESKGENEEVITVLKSDVMKTPLTLKQDDPFVINTIRKKYLIPPSTEPYNLKGKPDESSQGQPKLIRELLKEKRNGFFIECGGCDGEKRANTLGFEMLYGWEGVLIEGDPKNFELLLQKNRKVWSVQACLSILPHPVMVLFMQWFVFGRIITNPVMSKTKMKNTAEVQCFPLYSILLALNRTTVDYFSLDVEGHEVEVLQTIPWDKVNITTLSVEFIHGKSGKNGLRSFMKSKGYKTYKEEASGSDLIFYHPSLLTLSEK